MTMATASTRWLGSQAQPSATRSPTATSCPRISSRLSRPTKVGTSRRGVQGRLMGALGWWTLRHGGVLMAQPLVSVGPPCPLVLSPWMLCSVPDHVTVEMSVRVQGQNIVRASFTIYDCGRVGQVYPHTA